MALKPKFHGSIPIDDNSYQLQIDATLVSIAHTAGETEEWFIRAYTGEAIASGRVGAQLVEELQQRIRTATGRGSFTVTVSDDGIVTMADSTSFSVTWWYAALRNILGWTGNLSGASSYTAPNQHMYGWYPDDALEEREGDEREEGLESADATVRRAPSGDVVGMVFAEFVDRAFSFGWVPKIRARPVPADGQTTANRVVNRSFTEFWRQCAMRRWRWYPDATKQYRDHTDAAGAPWEYKFDEETVSGGPRNALSRSTELVDLYYRVQFSAHAYRSSS